MALAYVSPEAPSQFHYPGALHCLTEFYSWCKLCKYRWYFSPLRPHLLLVAMLNFLVYFTQWHANPFIISLHHVLSGRIVLEALILTLAVVSSLTAYTFWAAKKGKDFSFLGPILFTSLIILIVTGFLQVLCLPNPATTYQPSTV